MMTIPAILYEDENWLAVNKPTGFGTHAARPGGMGMAEWLALHQDRTLHICSRLDKGTSGVLLFAKNSLANGQAQDIHEQESSRKTYRFLTTRKHQTGKQDGTSWERDDPLDGKKCSTEFRLIEEGHGYFCYEAVIRRGRTHQIRRHAALSGIPILGDEEYGGDPFHRLCLHCCILEWPVIDRHIAVEQPDSFSLLLQGMQGLIVEGAVALERRGGWPLSISNSCRLIHRGEVRLPVSIDLYDSWLSVTGYSEVQSSETILKELQPLLDYLSSKMKCRGGLLRQHVRNPHQKKLIHDVCTWGEPLPDQVLATEHELSYGVNINDSQHVGLFLDQRDSRRRIQKVAGARRVANLFSFTCSFSAAAVAGGAEVVFSIDLAGSTLARGKDNFSLNGLTEGGKGKFIKEDVCKWLTRQENKYIKDPATFAHWDLVICDPPVFASGGKGRGFHVEKQWPELARQIRLLLSDRGLALFANNHRSGKSAFYLRELEKQFRTVVPLTPPLDFPTLPGEPDHVRIYWCEV